MKNHHHNTVVDWLSPDINYPYTAECHIFIIYDLFLLFLTWKCQKKLSKHVNLLSITTFTVSLICLSNNMTLFVITFIISMFFPSILQKQSGTVLCQNLFFYYSAHMHYNTKIQLQSISTCEIMHESVMMDKLHQLLLQDSMS